MLMPCLTLLLCWPRCFCWARLYPWLLWCCSWSWAHSLPPHPPTHQRTETTTSRAVILIKKVLQDPSQSADQSQFFIPNKSWSWQQTLHGFADAGFIPRPSGLQDI